MIAKFKRDKFFKNPATRGTLSFKQIFREMSETHLEPFQPPMMKFYILQKIIIIYV